MSIFSSFDISSSGMAAQRLRIQVITSNLANADSVDTPEGGPYRRKDVVLAAQNGTDFKQCLSGVIVKGIIDDKSSFIKKYEPNNPLAGKDGYVLYPNVNPVEEMANLLNAVRSFEANVTAMNALKEIMFKALELGR